jgi:hypothetical protein
VRRGPILYRAGFPIRSIEPVDTVHGSDTRSMAAGNTSGFNWRSAAGVYFTASLS